MLIFQNIDAQARAEADEIARGREQEFIHRARGHARHAGTFISSNPTYNELLLLIDVLGERQEGDAEMEAVLPAASGATFSKSGRKRRRSSKFVDA